MLNELSGKNFGLSVQLLNVKRFQNEQLFFVWKSGEDMWIVEVNYMV